MKLPFLADAQRVRQVPSASDAALLGLFGELADRLAEPPVIEALSSAKSNLGTDWERAVAREILLAHSWGKTIPPEISKLFANGCPFEGGPELSDFSGKRISVACFPTDERMASPVSQPPWFLLWLTDKVPEATDHSSQIEEWAKANLPVESCSVFLVTKSSTKASPAISQRSWTLAARLAIQALDSSAEIRRRLACDWIVTGDVKKSGAIERVDTGGKVRIKARPKWMFPAINRPDVAGHADRLNAWFPSTLDAAWALLSNQGVVDVGQANWPQEVEVVHSFTSGAWQPVMATLLLVAPRRLVLWHSKEDISKKPAEAIRDLLRPGFWTDKPPTVELNQVDSGAKQNVELAEVLASLRKPLEADLAGGETVLFNVTQGNRMMAFAAHSLAQQHSNLWLLYRDLDAADFEFTSIRYDGLMPTTETIRVPSDRDMSAVARAVPGEVWKLLFFKPTPRPPDTAEKMREVLGGQNVGAKIAFPTETRRTTQPPKP